MNMDDAIRQGLDESILLPTGYLVEFGDDGDGENGPHPFWTMSREGTLLVDAPMGAAEDDLADFLAIQCDVSPEDVTQIIRYLHDAGCID